MCDSLQEALPPDCPGRGEDCGTLCHEGVCGNICEVALDGGKVEVTKHKEPIDER